MAATPQARPRAGHVFVVRETRETSDSGLILLAEPDKQPTLLTGVIHSRGADVPTDYELGLRVVFKPWQSTEVEIKPDFRVYLVPVDDILAVVEDDPK